MWVKTWGHSTLTPACTSTFSLYHIHNTTSQLTLVSRTPFLHYNSLFFSIKSTTKQLFSLYLSDTWLFFLFFFLFLHLHLHLSLLTDSKVRLIFLSLSLQFIYGTVNFCLISMNLQDFFSFSLWLLMSLQRQMRGERNNTHSVFPLFLTHSTTTDYQRQCTFLTHQTHKRYAQREGKETSNVKWLFGV